MYPRVGRKPVQWRPAMTHMVVDINQARCYIEIRNIHNFPGLIRRNVFLDGSDLALENTDVSYLIDVIRRVNYMPAFQQQVVTLARLSKHREWKCEEACDENNKYKWRFGPDLHRTSLGLSKRKCIHWERDCHSSKQANSRQGCKEDRAIVIWSLFLAWVRPTHSESGTAHGSPYFRESRLHWKRLPANPGTRSDDASRCGAHGSATHRTPRSARLQNISAWDAGAFSRPGNRDPRPECHQA